MKREELKVLGLNDEQVEAVMSSHGQTVQSINSKLLTAEQQATELQTQLNDRDKDIANLQKGTKDNESLQATITELQDKYQQAQSENETNRLSHAIDLMLLDSVHDTSIVKGQLDMSKLSLKDGAVVGLDEQINPLKETKGFLFKQEKPKENGGIASIFGHTPAQTNAANPPKISLGTMIGQQVAQKKQQ